MSDRASCLVLHANIDETHHHNNHSSPTTQSFLVEVSLSYSPPLSPFSFVCADWSKTIFVPLRHISKQLGWLWLVVFLWGVTDRLYHSITHHLYHSIRSHSFDHTHSTWPIRLPTRAIQSHPFDQIHILHYSLHLITFTPFWTAIFVFARLDHCFNALRYVHSRGAAPFKSKDCLRWTSPGQYWCE